jgi:hypothetical protein
MNVEYTKKPSATTQVDYSKRRHQPEKDDLELSAAAQVLLASIEESARPKQLPAVFPRIVNRMAKLWKMPREMDRYLDELLTDSRGNRKGFALNILMDLSTLKDYYDGKVFPTRHDVWDS